VSALLAANLGNTRVALGVFPLLLAPGMPEPTLGHVFALPLPADGDLPARMRPSEPVEAAVLASVNPPREREVRDWIARHFGVTPLSFPAEVAPLVENRCRPPGAAGADRLANATAAYAKVQGPCVLIDAGTAVTVDAVSADGEFLGGAILPGLSLWTRALAEGTALLPEVGLGELPPAIGASTSDAIASGALRGLAGAIDRLVTDLSAELGNRVRVVATGGDASRLLSLCRTEAELWPNLTLAGLALAYAAHAGR